MIFICFLALKLNLNLSESTIPVDRYFFNWVDKLRTCNYPITYYQGLSPWCTHLIQDRLVYPDSRQHYIPVHVFYPHLILIEKVHSLLWWWETSPTQQLVPERGTFRIDVEIWWFLMLHVFPMREPS